MENCLVTDCLKHAKKRGMCEAHYRHALAHGEISSRNAGRCTVENCGRPTYARDVCGLHYKRLRRHGDPATVTMRPSGTGNFTVDGYFRITVDGKRMQAHRYIMEQHLGRTLRPDEHVHHKNGNKSDNRLENLGILDWAEHQREHRLRRYCSDAHVECLVCHQIKPRTAFWADRKSWTGVQRLCKACRPSRAKA